MSNTNSTLMIMCFPKVMANFVIVVTFITLPFHILMIKVLLVDLRLALPRHMVVFCLAISDAWQIFMAFSCAAVTQIFSWTTVSKGCHITRNILFFNLAMTVAVSSLSIIALSFERYVACIHSFRLHQIFTRDRMLYGISCTWLIGVICGTFVVVFAAKTPDLMVLDVDQSMKIIAMVFVIPTSVFVSVIQYRLLVFSMKKLQRVGTGKTFGSEAEIADLRKKQIKVSFVASIVVFVYVVSMYPAGFLSFLELIGRKISSEKLYSFFNALTFLNNLADPFIYGIGIVDTRRAVLNNLKKMKEFFALHLCIDMQSNTSCSVINPQ